MTSKNALVITDNQTQLLAFKNLLSEVENDWLFSFAGSTQKFVESNSGMKLINVNEEYNYIINNYQLVISLHCKQLFPPKLVNAVKCINVHPGLNPYNRGWYPQVFSIINKLPVGATIHEIDEKIDHGKIIAKKELEVFSWDTSLTVYNRILDLEIQLLRNNLNAILSNSYKPVQAEFEGNVNLKKDFNALKMLNLDSVMTAGELIDRMRALTHGDWSNLFYIDKTTGKKIFIKIILEVNEE